MHFIFYLQVNDYISSQPGGEDQTPYTVKELALGFIKVANESMCRPIRNLTQARGHDTAQHVLACFGGAGGQHACAIARSLGMSTVFIHRYEAIPVIRYQASPPTFPQETRVFFFHQICWYLVCLWYCAG